MFEFNALNLASVKPDIVTLEIWADANDSRRAPPSMVIESVLPAILERIESGPDYYKCSTWLVRRRYV